MATTNNKSNSLVTPEFHGATIRLEDTENMMCLTDMWKASGSSSTKKPIIFLRQEPIVELIGQIKKVTPHHLLVKSEKGRTGGTWAHVKIALAYAKFLSPEFHLWALQVIQDRIEEDQNPELGIQRSRERAIANWKKMGRTDEWIACRMRGIEFRNAFTGTIAGRCPNEKNPHGVITNALYVGTLGNTAAGLREERNLPPKANMREHLDEHELLMVMLAESATIRKVEQDRLFGRDPIAHVANRAGKAISDAVNQVMSM